MTDPLIREIRRIRDESARRHGFDAMAMAETFMHQQGKSGRELVDRRPALAGTKKPRRAAMRRASLKVKS